jgi:hypothetical protein
LEIALPSRILFIVLAWGFNDFEDDEDEPTGNASFVCFDIIVDSPLSQEAGA